MHTYYSETLTSDRSNFWIETEKRINTDCAFIRYILCVIPLIQEDLFNNSNGNHRQHFNTVIKTFFLISMMIICMVLLIPFELNILIPFIIMILLTVMDSSAVANIFVMVIVICGIKNTLYRAPKLLLL